MTTTPSDEQQVLSQVGEWFELLQQQEEERITLIQSLTKKGCFGEPSIEHEDGEITETYPCGIKRTIRTEDTPTAPSCVIWDFKGCSKRLQEVFGPNFIDI